MSLVKGTLTSKKKGQMRSLVVVERLFFKAGFVQGVVTRQLPGCISWEGSDQLPSQRSSIDRTRDGVSIVLQLSPSSSGGREVIANWSIA